MAVAESRRLGTSQSELRKGGKPACTEGWEIEFVVRRRCKRYRTDDRRYTPLPASALRPWTGEAQSVARYIHTDIVINLKPVASSATRLNAVFVLHAFQKKTQTTARRDIDIAKARFAELMRGRK